MTDDRGLTYLDLARLPTDGAPLSRPLHGTIAIPENQRGQTPLIL
jgi:hypothetical protein